MSNSQEEEKKERPFRYRVTGDVSVGRLKGLMKQTGWEIASSDCKEIDFVWETASYQFREIHKHAKVLNRISGLDPIQNKSSLAYLQQKLKIGVLPTYVIKGVNHPRMKALLKEKGMWICKPILAQNGLDKIVFRPDEDPQPLLNELKKSNDTYVVQKYIENPHLWDGLKYDLRVYVVIKADFSVYIYRKILPRRCVVPFTTTSCDLTHHITNYCVSQTVPGFKQMFENLGELQVVREDNWPLYNEVWPKIEEILRELICKLEFYAHYQLNPNHFEMLGFDFVYDNQKKLWLIEANRNPGLENIGHIVENKLFIPMMKDILGMFVFPVILGKDPEPGDWKKLDLPELTPRTYTEHIENNILSYSMFLHRARKIVDGPVNKYQNYDF